MYQVPQHKTEFYAGCNLLRAKRCGMRTDLRCHPRRAECGTQLSAHLYCSVAGWRSILLRVRAHSLQTMNKHILLDILHVLKCSRAFIVTATFGNINSESACSLDTPQRQHMLPACMTVPNALFLHSKSVGAYRLACCQSAIFRTA